MRREIMDNLLRKEIELTAYYIWEADKRKSQEQCWYEAEILVKLDKDVKEILWGQTDR